LRKWKNAEVDLSATDSLENAAVEISEEIIMEN